MSKPTLTIGLIGYQFMGRAHSNAYRQVGHFFDLPVTVRMKTLCGRDVASVQRAAVELGWEQSETSWQAVVTDPEIDVIDISTPGDTHCEIAIAAAKAGKAVWCEKPLANSLEQAEAMFLGVNEAGVANGIFHNYRKVPAIALAKQWLDEGKLGRLFHFRARYLQDWLANPLAPHSWRLEKERAGSGAHGDINAHLIDLARFLVGEFHEVCGTMRTFVNERPLPDGSGTGHVSVDDAVAFLARIGDDVMATFEATRFATGRKNNNCFEINGEKGSIFFDFERMNEVELFLTSDSADQQGFRTIQATAGVHPYASRYWPVGHGLGYEHTFINWVADAILAMHAGQPITPSFADGLANQKVLNAVEQSHAERGWVSL